MLGFYFFFGNVIAVDPLQFTNNFILRMKEQKIPVRYQLPFLSSITDFLEKCWISTAALLMPVHTKVS